LAGASPLQAVVELNGLGYEVNIPITTSERLPPAGSPVKLHTHVVYREDAQTLYGFATAAERDFFRLMIERVTGIGPKIALGIMSRLSLPLLEGAIRAGDVGTLSKCPATGIMSIATPFPPLSPSATRLRRPIRQYGAPAWRSARKLTPRR
jgi:Holliday junction DNA helicase RuvA